MYADAPALVPGRNMPDINSSRRPCLAESWSQTIARLLLLRRSRLRNHAKSGRDNKVHTRHSLQPNHMLFAVVSKPITQYTPSFLRPRRSRTVGPNTTRRSKKSGRCKTPSLCHQSPRGKAGGACVGEAQRRSASTTTMTTARTGGRAQPGLATTDLRTKS